MCPVGLSRLLLPVHVPPGNLPAGMQPPTLQHDVGDASEEDAGKTRFTCCGFGGGKKRSASHK